MLAHTKKDHINEVFFAFHGYGQDERVFSRWQKTLPKDALVYTFPLLPSDSLLNEQGCINKERWRQEFQDFIEREGLSKISLIAFSLGARQALMLMQEFPKFIHSVVLIAPDGLFPHPFFKTVTSSRFSFKVFSYILNKQGVAQAVLKLFSAVPSMRKLALFAERNIGTNEKRAYLLKVWWAYRKFEVIDLSELVNTVQRYEMKVSIYLASNDWLIPNRKIIRWYRNHLPRHQLMRMSYSHFQVFDKALDNLAENQIDSLPISK